MKKIKIRKINMAYLSKTYSRWEKRVGKKAKRILEPSRGGKGIRLKKARRIFKKTIIPQIKKNGS
jgi:hypothetical protein